MNFRDITKFFRIRSSSAFLDLAGRGLSFIPAERSCEALSLILRAYLFLNKQKISDQEFEDLILITAKKNPGSNAAEKIVTEAAENARSLEKSLFCAHSLSSLPLENKLSFAALLLEFDKSYLPVHKKTEEEFRQITEQLSLREKSVNDLLEQDAKRRATASKVLNSGAGILVAAIVLLLFLLAATFMRSLFFGIILAYLMLPLEKYFETRFFRSKYVVCFSKLFALFFLPLAKLKNKVQKNKILSRAEHVKSERKSLILKSTFATFISLLVMVVLVLILLTALIVPTAMSVGRDLSKTISSSSAMKNLEQQLEYYLPAEKKPEPNLLDKLLALKKKKEDIPAPPPEEIRVEEEKNSFTKLLRKLRPKLKAYTAKHKEELTKFAFSQSKGVVAALLTLAKFLGNILFDLLLTIFFFLYFLQQMAFFTNSAKGGKKQNKKLQSVGQWAVKGIFDSTWLPSVSQDTKEEAINIIDRISNMFRCWAKGYLTIIVIEAPLYVILFSLLSVPYGVLLGLISSTTVLLPVLGLAGCITLTVCTCIAFCEANLAGTLIGVLCVYLLVNGILEQLILYPNLVGGSIGLTILETIIVVLLGGLFAGVAGMIFAVPAAAVIKYLIPKIYKIWSEEPEGKRS